MADVFNGKTPSKAEQRDNGHPVLKVRDVDEHGQHRGTTKSFVDPALAARNPAKCIKAGDTLILNAAHNAHYVASKTYFAGNEAAGSLATGEWLLVRPHAEAVLPAFLNYWLRCVKTRDLLRFLVKGIHLYPKDVAELAVAVPAMEEQRHLVDFLSRAEGIVRLRREAQQKAAELIPAIFIDMFGDPATNPKGWPVQSLGDLLEIPLRNGVSPARSGRYVGRVLTLSAITRGRFDESAVKAALFASPISARDEVTTEDFLICRGNGNRSLVGAGCFPSRGMSEVAFPDTMIALRPIPLMLVSSYLAGIWGTAFIRQQIDSIAKTTNGTYKINQKGIEGIKIVVPPISRQLQFASLLQAIESLTLQQSEAVKKADATFDALLAQAFH